MLRRENGRGNIGAAPAAGPDGGMQVAPYGVASVFKELICIAALANQGGEDVPGEESANGTARPMLRTEHHAVFERWLYLKLRDKMADLDACAADQGRSPIEIVRYWIQPRCQQRLIPPDALRSQRDLLDLEFEILLPIVAANSDTSQALL
jgi:hypothetical protein